MSNGNGNGCIPIDECGEKQSPPQLKIVENPQGSGGQALTHNFKEIHYRQPACSYEIVPPQPKPGTNDGDPDYCVGSRWLETNVSEGVQYKKMWICVDGGEGGSGAVWVPWFRWHGDWQDQVEGTLVVDNWPAPQNLVQML